MKPKPLVGLNHLTVPVAILRLRKRALPGGRPCRSARQPIWTSSFRRRSETQVWTPRKIRTAAMLSPDYSERSTVKRPSAPKLYRSGPRPPLPASGGRGLARGKKWSQACSSATKGLPMAKDDYDATLEMLQIQLVETQAWAIEQGLKIVIVLEGRDAAGKDGAIKRMTEYMAPRQTRVIALPKPYDRELTQWYFQRYANHLPAAGETVFFNRSWYNRAGVEPVMGFCTPEQHERFLHDAPHFE